MDVNLTIPEVQNNTFEPPIEQNIQNNVRELFDNLYELGYNPKSSIAIV